MRTLVLSLATLSLAAFAWQFGTSYRALDAARQHAAQAAPIDFDALHAQARGALERLREKERDHSRLTMNDRALPSSVR